LANGQLWFILAHYRFGTNRDQRELTELIPN
jgi:hypothetical protein